MFTLPQSVQIGSYTCPVVEHDKHVYAKDGEYLFGIYYPQDNTINVGMDNKHQQRGVETFIHECMEAVKELYDIKMDHQSLSSMSQGLAQAFISGKVSFENVE